MWLLLKIRVQPVIRQLRRNITSDASINEANSPKVPLPLKKRQSKEEILIKKIQESDAQHIAPPKPEWIKREEALERRYGKWNPTRKLSLQQMNDIRALSEQMPNLRTVDFATYYNISPEAIRRILKSKWVPSDKDEGKIIKRKEKRKEERLQAKTAPQPTRNKYAKAVSLNEVTIDTPAAFKKYGGAFTSKDGKLKYDSTKNHGYYSKKKKKRIMNMPYTRSASDLLD